MKLNHDTVFGLLTNHFLQNDLPREMINHILKYIPYKHVSKCVERCSNAPLIGCRACHTHLCRIPECGMVVAGVYVYCGVHSCRYYYCSKPALPNKYFCLSHKCIYSTCENPIHDGERLCESHVTQLLKCAKCTSPPAGINQDYCILHKCQVMGCTMPRYPGSNLCLSCTCAEPNCDYQRYSGIRGSRSEYCALHKCQNCVRVATTMSIYCRSCVE